MDEVDTSDGTREEVSHSSLDKAWCQGRQAFPEPQVLPQSPGAGSGRRAKKNEVHIHRLRSHLVGKVNDLVFDDDHDNQGAEDSAAAGGKTPFQGESEVACVISDAQQARRYLQAMTVLHILEEERVRDLLILEHTQAASDSLEADASAGKQWLKRLWRMLLSFGSKVPFC